ncbi:MAG: phosphotransferase family protein [Thermodesulfobacteriota bacterium]
MVSLYLGKLEHADPLYEILLSQVCPQVKDPIFHVDRMPSREVYKYTEEKTRARVIGKFFKPDDPQLEKVVRKKGEYENLKKMRAFGFDTSPNYVVRPISREERIGLALLEEFIHGKDLDYFLKRAIYERDEASLKENLSRLASFLYAFHGKTELRKNVDLDPVGAYFRKVLNKLMQQEILTRSEQKVYLKLMDRWLNNVSLQKAREVIVHGDATPTNFIFTRTYNAVAIDLERMKNADSAFDISMICGEIKHAYLWRTGNPYEAEPLIRHFFESYSSNFPDCKKAFREITSRNPFYMAMTELRIARNGYLDYNYRRTLAHEALNCLKWGLKLR